MYPARNTQIHCTSGMGTPWCKMVHCAPSLITDAAHRLYSQVCVQAYRATVTFFTAEAHWQHLVLSEYLSSQGPQNTNTLGSVFNQSVIKTHCLCFCLWNKSSDSNSDRPATRRAWAETEKAITLKMWCIEWECELRAFHWLVSGLSTMAIELNQI